MSTGSRWGKWDLHFHTPSSYDYEDKSVTNQEIIDTLISHQVEVVAITDHHVIDIERIKELQKLGKDKITVLPGIEFRSELGGNESVHFIGIFPENSDIQHIWINLQSTCELTEKFVADKGGDAKIHCDLKDTCRLIHSLGGIVSVHAGGKSNSIENITNSLPYKMALKTDLVLNHIDILELGSEENQKDYIDIVFPAIKHQLPMIICSDNHNIKNYIIKQNLWIKGDPTYEGLRQIYFEPSYRVHIGENHPISPPIRINKVSFDFPKEAKFENEIFCLAGKHEIELSPNFTCFIGGRGTGKSTILNLIHEKLRPNENQFFRDRKIKDNTGKPISISMAIDIDNDADEKYIDFLSQNEVEEFAQDYQKLTSSVYARIIKRDEDGLINQYEEELKKELELLNNHILNKIDLSKFKLDLEQKKRELGANKKIIESFSSSEYININSELKEITLNLNAINLSKNKFTEIIEESRKITDKFKQVEPANHYDTQINIIVKGIEKLILEAQSQDFTVAENAKTTLGQNLSRKREELKQYLSDKGLTEENQKDIANANVTTSQIEQKISEKIEEIAALENKINTFDIHKTKQSSTAYQNELIKNIKQVSDILEQLESSSVKPISLLFEFDNHKAFDEIFSDFKLAFEEDIKNSKHKGDNILREILFSIPPSHLKDRESFIETLSNHSSSSAAKSFLIELFAKESNFEIYQLICKFNFLDFATFKKVKVQYDGRPIENSSFGQRCTAVLVILLLLGNNQIIIDEPEAHLDSLLISNYLVDVIKDRKSNRQIIFATHNANFVINGDAELIHILNINESSQTTLITSTTIENPKTREDLIGLEGGREAFEKRENRYQ